MATREEIAIAQQTLQILNNCQRDLRANAQSYLNEIASGHARLSTEQLGTIVNADGAAISRLMTTITDFASDAGRKTKLTNGLLGMGLSVDQVLSDSAALKTVADAQAAAAVGTDDAITTAANATLGSVAPVDLLF